MPLSIQWKPVSGYPSYGVSNWGDVRNITTGRILKPIKHSKGYLQIQLSLNGKPKTFYIHRLVWENHVDSITDTIDHINSVKKNNFILNLQELSSIDNKKKYHLEKTRNKTIYIWRHLSDNTEVVCDKYEFKMKFPYIHIKQIDHHLRQTGKNKSLSIKGWCCTGCILPEYT